MHLAIHSLVRRAGRKTAGGALLALTLAAAGVGTLFFGNVESASAHCDSTSGPVVNAAKEALETGDVTHILPYVQPAEEAELTAAFEHALEVRKAGGEAQALADRYFWETAVRLHRQGEGAAYTGLKENVELEPALAAAEEALESGKINDVYKTLDKEIRTGVEERYHAVLAAREAEAKNKTVETSRVRVEAEFEFEKYILGISQAATAAAGHAEGEAPATGHAHE